MAEKSRVRDWARDLGLSDRGVARLFLVSPWTVISWRTTGRAHEPADWEQRAIAGLEKEILRLRALAKDRLG